MNRILIIILAMSLCQNCNPAPEQQGDPDRILTGADQLDSYLNLLKGKTIAIVANQTSEVDGRHLVDTLLTFSEQYAFRISHVYAPEHGFRGFVDDGVWVSDETDAETGLPIISVYGKHKKPQPSSLEGIDMVIFDIQDVGTRFYTYISTLHYVMEACAELGVPLLILDRPNPNGNYTDGPILEPGFSSFVGMHEIPVVHGLTIGELAQMINGEKWLQNGVQTDLKIIPCKNYTHKSTYILPVKPSPNLPTQHSIRLYPSTCFFEGTVISEGRGTERPFEMFGHPDLPYEFSYVPRPIKGMDSNPKHEGKQCFGMDLREEKPEEGWSRLYLHWLIDAYQAMPDQSGFFNPHFDRLAGTDRLRKQIQQGLPEEKIRDSWQEGLKQYRVKREKYLIYP